MNYAIDKNLPLPLYYQLKEIIINLIKDGVYAEDTAIPTEFELIKKYEISRTTVRQALNELVNEGVLYKKKGIGTFVASQKQQDLHDNDINQSLYKLSRIINQNGYVCRKEFLEVGEMVATPEISEHLGINIGDPIWYLDRIHYAEHKPSSFTRSYVRKEFLKNLDKDGKKAAAHFYQYLRDNGYKVSTVTEKFIPGFADKNARKVLEIDKKTPILIIEITGSAEDGTVIEYTVSITDTTFIDIYATFKAE